MKKKCLCLIFSIVLTLSLSSCGSKATEVTTESIKETSESIMVESVSDPTSTPTPTPTPTPTATPTPTPTATPESSDKSVDDIASAKSYTLSEQEKADLRALGATEEQINNVKSGQDFIDLVYKLVNGDSIGSSGTAGGSSSSSTDTDSSESFGDEVHDPSRVPQLDADDGSLPGRM